MQGIVRVALTKRNTLICETKATGAGIERLKEQLRDLIMQTEDAEYTRAAMSKQEEMLGKSKGNG
jgi:hypothetical protein